MILRVELRPEVQAELARQAAAQGRVVEAYAASLLEEAPHLPPFRTTATQAKDLVELFEPIRGLLTDEEIDRIFSRNPSQGRRMDLG